MKQRVIISGYPKSGNTWLTRLTAEIIGCPVTGFWCDPLHPEQAIEGKERESSYECFKAHHNLNQLKHTLSIYGNGSEKIIYIVRDPRDIIISASNFFILEPRFEKLHRFLSLIPSGLRLYYLFHTKTYRQDRFTDAILNGNRKISWLGTPWKEHVEGYLSSDALILRYEDLHHSPQASARSICSYLNIERSVECIEKSIQIQSFAKKKAALSGNATPPHSVLRKGTLGEWRSSLTSANAKRVIKELHLTLKKLGYETDE